MLIESRAATTDHPNAEGYSLAVPAGWSVPLAAGSGYGSLLVGPVPQDQLTVEVVQGDHPMLFGVTATTVLSTGSSTINIGTRSVDALVSQLDTGGFGRRREIQAGFVHPLSGTTHAFTLRCSSLPAHAAVCDRLLNSWRWEDGGMASGVHSGRLYGP